MAMHKVRLTIQDMTWERCVSRVENTLRNLAGVLRLEVGLTDKNTGEATITYNPAEVSVEDLKRVIPAASGEKHNFGVISVVEED